MKNRTLWAVSPSGADLSLPHSLAGLTRAVITLTAALLILAGAGTKVRAAETRYVHACTDLQTQIDAANYGDTIIVDANLDCEMAIYLPYKGAGSGTDADYITIQSSALSSLPEGRRVSPADAINMPKLRPKNYDTFSYGPSAVNTCTPTSVSPSCSNTTAGPHHWKLVGFELTSKLGSRVDDLVVLGDNSSAQTATLEPHHLIVDRCYIHSPSDTTHTRRGVGVSSRDTTVSNSYISGLKLLVDDAAGSDSQAVAILNSTGRIHVINNYLEAAGENVLISNFDSLGVVSDVEIRRNHLFKPLSWYPNHASYQNMQWVLKAILELKQGNRVTVDGNVLENMWCCSGERGWAVLINPLRQGSGDNRSVTDLTITNNKIQHAAGGILVIGGDYTEQVLDRVTIRNNLLTDINSSWGGGDYANGKAFTISAKANNVTVEHNTVINSGKADGDLTGTASSGFVFRNNIANGDVSQGVAPGDATLDLYYTSPSVWMNNLQVAATGTYVETNHTGNILNVTSYSGVGFANLAGGDYRLLSSSPGYHAGTDGKDVGADMDAIDAAMAGGQSLSLDGTGDYVLVSSTTSLSIGGPITVEAWFKVNSIGAYQTIVAKESYMVSGTGGGYELQITNTGKVRANFYQDYNAYLPAVGTTTVTPGVWHHAAATFDGTTRRVFLDGVLEVSAAGGGPGTGSGNLRIGRRNNSTNTYYFNGLIDEVRVSNAALYSANFTPQVYLTATTGTTMGLWKFDGGTANDSSGNANHGTLQGGATYSTDVPNNYSLSLNGTNAYVLAPYSTSLDIAGPITIEAWVKYNSTGAYQTIVARESLQQTTGGGYELQITNTGKLRMNLWTAPTSYASLTGATTLSTGAWHHVVGQADSVAMRLYVDGVLDNSAAGSLPATGGGSLRIGRRSHSTNTYYFNGLIDEVRVSNAALYSANFTPLRGLAPGASTMGLWKFNDQTAADTSGNGNNGTLQGAAAFSTDAP